MTFLTGSPFTVDSSLHVPSLSVGFTYTKGSWWIVTIFSLVDIWYPRGFSVSPPGQMIFLSLGMTWVPL